MKVSQLVEELSKYPSDMEVCIFDSRKNIRYADDEPNGIGITKEFVVILEDEPGTPIPFIGLHFINDDYADDSSSSEDAPY